MGNKRGRPIGYKMTERTKNKISGKMTGRNRKLSTKAKISDGVNKLHETGAPIELIMITNLAEAKKHKANRYVNVYIGNPVVGAPGYSSRLHRTVIEQSIGRKLKRDEYVHHMGGKDLNDLEYLRLVNINEHRALDRFKKRRIEKFGTEAEYDKWLILINGGTE